MGLFRDFEEILWDSLRFLGMLGSIVGCYGFLGFFEGILWGFLVVLCIDNDFLKRILWDS